MEAYLWIIWLSVFVIALIIEACTTELVSIWFSAGAVIALILSFIPAVAWWIEVIVFVVVSFTTFLCLRPFLMKLMKKDLVNTNIDEIIGKKGIMTLSSNELEAGEAKINGVLWTAVNVDESEPLEKDCKIVVVAIKGNKLIVKKAKEN